MTPELTAYLERLVHPTRKAYATAYAEHIVTGAAQPEVPSGMDSDTAAKIVRKVTRYAAAPCTPSAGVSAPTLTDLAETMRAYAAERGDAELAGLVDAFVPGE